MLDFHSPQHALPASETAQLQYHGHWPHRYPEQTGH